MSRVHQIAARSKPAGNWPASRRMPLARQRGLLDPVKRYVADLVQYHLLTGKDQPAYPAGPAAAAGWSSKAITPLITEVTVRDGRRTRRFTVKVAETEYGEEV